MKDFWDRVEFTDTCWIWRGTTGRGYGQASINGKSVYAHRYAYEFCVGPIPEGLTLDHLCRTTLCVLPDHLEPVTMRENILRGTGPTAKNARKTHCIRGHEFTEENTYVPPAKPRGRECHMCRIIYQEELRAS